ncbi:MAG: aminoacyl-tRNA deacylase [Candidatus Hodarchaeota archaeon]
MHRVHSGSISPFGTKRDLPIYLEKTILDLHKLYINAGRRRFVIEMKHSELVRILRPKLMNVARKTRI